MKKSLKILSVIIILLIGFMIFPAKIYATDLTEIPVIGEEGTGTGTGTGTGSGSTIIPVNDDKLADDKVADDKVLPDAGFDSNMVYIIAALAIFAVFAYVKVVKYNVD